MLEGTARGWLSVVILQSVGSIFVCYSQKSDPVHYIESTPQLQRAHALSLILVNVLRFILMSNFRCVNLHIAHSLLSLLACVHTLLEVFHFGTMTYELPTVTEVTLNGFSAIVMPIFLYTLTKADIESAKTEKKKERKISAKHFMESDVLKMPSQTTD